MVIAPHQRQALTQRSKYLQYLPPIYSESDFVGRFLMIFESILGPIEDVIGNLSYYFDPLTAPEELLPWLASWVNVEVDESWPIEKRRQLIRYAVELFRWRGTSRGLKEYLRIYAGVEPRITENYGGMPLTDQSRLGLNTVLGSSDRHTFTVTLEVEDPESLNLEHIRAIIESEKPAHVAYKLEILKKQPETTQVDASPSPEAHKDIGDGLE